MNYEQKHKEDLEAAKGWLEIAKKDNNTMATQILEKFFPELKESEEERIRKALIRFFSKGAEYDSSTNGIKDRNIIAWLEKQKKENFIDKNLVKEEAHQIAWETSKHYDPNACKQEWCEMAALDMAYWFENQSEQKPAWSEEDERNLEGIIDEIEANKNDAPDYDLVTYDGFLSWLKSLKDRIQPQPKQEWSEKDKNMKSLIISTLTSMGTLNLERYHHMNLDEVKDWLKSLKPNHWKPSDEQLKALNWVAYNYALMDKGTEEKLQSLYNDLKTL